MQAGRHGGCKLQGRHGRCKLQGCQSIKPAVHPRPTLVVFQAMRSVLTVTSPMLTPRGTCKHTAAGRRL